jgi:hypothetical protein
MKEIARNPFSPDTDSCERVDAGLGEIHLSARSLLVFVAMLLLFMLASRPLVDPDFWWHLRTGQYIVETGAIPHTDIFSHAFFGREWVAHEWLSEIFIYAVHQALGYGGLVVTFSIIIVAALWVTYRECARRAGHPYVTGFALILGGLASAPTWGVRPQMFSFLFASIFIAVLVDYLRNGNKGFIWWLLPLMILWVNMHAGFALGLALIALAIIGLMLDQWLAPDSECGPLWGRMRPLCLVWLACVMAVSLNPNGVRIYSYPFETLTSHAMMKYINEWFSPDFHELMFLPLAVLIFATFTVMVMSKERARPSELLLLSVTGFAALRSGRNVPFFALAAMPLLAEHSWSWLTSHRWGQWLVVPEKREAGAQAIIKVLMNVVLLVILPTTLCVLRVRQVIANRATTEAQNFPVAAVEFIRSSRPPQPIYNEYGWGGYMIWKLHPEYRVYIDGRADVYGDQFIEEFLRTHDGEGNWRAPLDRYGVRTVVVNPRAALASLLRQEEGWSKVFEDQQAAIFIKQ